MSSASPPTSTRTFAIATSRRMHGGGSAPPRRQERPRAPAHSRSRIGTRAAHRSRPRRHVRSDRVRDPLVDAFARRVRHGPRRPLGRLRMARHGRWGGCEPSHYPISSSPPSRSANGSRSCTTTATTTRLRSHRAANPVDREARLGRVNHHTATSRRSGRDRPCYRRPPSTRNCCAVHAPPSSAARKRTICANSSG